MSKKREPIVRAATPDGQRAGEAIIEIIENQLRENNPPETRQTLKRLIRLGETRENATRYIACVVAAELFYMAKKNEAYNRERYIENLKALPQLPDD
jgi:predicted nucleic acid-binding protein